MDTKRHQRGQERRRGGEGPDQMEARRVVEELADRRSDAEAAPDGQPVEADHPAPASGRGQVDDPGRARGEYRALPEPEHESSPDQTRQPGRQEVEQAGERGEQRPEDDDWLSTAVVREPAGERPAG